MADPSTYRPAPGHHPHRPGVYRFRDADRPGRLRRQGQEPAQPAVVVLPGPLRAAPAHPADGHHRGVGGVDGGRHRGRGAAAGVLLDQGVRPPVQRPLPRRQELPQPGRHAGGGVARGCRSCAGPSARACATSVPTPTPGRSGRPSTCCCGCSRPAPAPAASTSAPSRSAGPACSATSTSAPRPASAGSARAEHRGIVEDFCDFMAGHDRHLRPPAGEGDAGRGGRAGLRARRPPARRPRRAEPGHREAGRGARPTAPTPTWWPSPTTSSRPPSRCSTCAAAGSGASAAGWWTRSRRVTLPELVEQFLTTAYLDEAGEIPREVLVPALPATPTWWPSCSASCGAPGSTCGCPSAATSGPWPRPSRPTPSSPCGCTSSSGPATSPPAAWRCRRSRTRSAWSRRRCGSSASTSATCRAPTSSPRWSCSRTGCPARASTAGSPSGARRAASPTTPARMHQVLTRRFAATCEDRRRHRRAGRERPGPGHRRGPGGPRDRPARGGSPTRPSSSWSTAAPPGGRGGERPRRALGIDLDGPDGVAAGRPGQAAGGGLAARPAEPVILPRTSEGAVPAAARPRRGAPLRHHLPPPEAVEVDGRAPCSTTSPGSARPGARRCSPTSAR